MGKSNNGFTLLEIVIVLAILMVSLDVLSRLMTASLNQSVSTEEDTEIQITCQNMLNTIASGAIEISGAQSFEIPGFPLWSLNLTAREGILPSLVEITLSAQKYEETQEISPDDPNRYIVSRIPVSGRCIILTQWIKRDTLRFQKGEAPQSAQSIPTTETTMETIPDDIFKVTDSMKTEEGVKPESGENSDIFKEAGIFSSQTSSGENTETTPKEP